MKRIFGLLILLVFVGCIPVGTYFGIKEATKKEKNIFGKPPGITEIIIKGPIADKGSKNNITWILAMVQKTI